MRFGSSFCKPVGVLLTAVLLALVPAQAQEKSAIVKALQPFVEKQEVAGMVTCVTDEVKILALDAIGYSSLDGKIVITTDGVFWIASMSKPITAVLLMMLVD